MATINHLFRRAVDNHLGGRIPQAKGDYLKVLEKEPAHVDAMHLLGLAELQTGNPQAAEHMIRKAIAANPDIAPFHSNLGNVLSTLGRSDEALACYRHAVEIDPKFTDGWNNLGQLASRQNNHEVAAHAYSALAALSEGKDGLALGYLALSLAVLCDWRNLALTQSALISHLSALTIPVPPFCALMLDLSPEQQLQIATLAAKTVHDSAMKAWPGNQPYPPRAFPSDRPQRIKIGYLGDDFQDHAVGYLFVGLIEAHDHARFETFIYSYGPADTSETRRRTQAAADHFIDIAPLNWVDAAKRIHADGIDILIDLKGHTGTPRAQILAPHPAPVQAAWLGYPGTFGGRDCDYIIADPFIIPSSEEACYSENVVRLPHCYQANDPKRPRADGPQDRMSAGLPTDAFVFGALNNTFKITETMFTAWMDILKQCPGSVLWLLDHHPVATANLKAAAKTQGVEPERLIFAPRVDQTSHMKRLSCCDLALDTYPYGGHTTTSDFLWAGVPVVTLAGRTFASRVAGSLCKAAGLEDLITYSFEDYAALAVSLFKDRDRLQETKIRTMTARDRSPLFNAPQFAKDFEAVLDGLYAQNVQ